MIFNKKGQLGIIEFKFFIIGFFLGLILTIILIALINSGVIGFNLPLVTCPAPSA